MINFNPQEIQLICGLGNPGDEYENTYHNLGKSFVKLLAQKKGYIQKFKKYKNGKFEYCEIKKNFFLMYPNIFMNNSGYSIVNAIHFFNITPSRFLLIHDENDLALGKYKIDFNRGAAGHNGVTSAIKQLDTKEFWRLRLGIQENMLKKNKAEELVLSTISEENKKKIEKLFQKIISSYFS